jgi:hypothetical protein
MRSKMQLLDLHPQPTIFLIHEIPKVSSCKLNFLLPFLHFYIGKHHFYWFACIQHTGTEWLGRHSLG